MATINKWTVQLITLLLTCELIKAFIKNVTIIIIVRRIIEIGNKR